LATLMALVLSHMRGTWEHSSPKSHSMYVIQSRREQRLATTSEDPKNWQVSEVDFRSARHPAKLASEKTRSEKEEDTEYQRPSSGV
jgi:hypothetical protein